jgi:hypothetical protein
MDRPRRLENPLRAHHNFVRQAILKVFLIGRNVTELHFDDLYLQLDADDVHLTVDSLKNYLEDMRDRGWLELEVQRTEKELRKITLVRVLPRGRDVFDGVVNDTGIPRA